MKFHVDQLIKSSESITSKHKHLLQLIYNCGGGKMNNSLKNILFKYANYEQFHSCQTGRKSRSLAVKFQFVVSSQLVQPELKRKYHA